MNMPRGSSSLKASLSHSAWEAHKLSGMSVYMINYLCREEILTPSVAQSRGRGNERRYSFSDVVILRALHKLLEAGISVKRLKEALGSLQAHGKSITPNTLPRSHLVTDGRKVYFKNQSEILALPSGQLAFAFVLDLVPLRDEVVAKAKNLKRSDEPHHVLRKARRS